MGGDIIARALQLDRTRLSRKIHNVEEVVVKAAAAANLPWAELDERLQQDVVRAELYARILEVAGETLSEEKLEALSRASASAAVGDAKLDLGNGCGGDRNQ